VFEKIQLVADKVDSLQDLISSQVRVSRQKIKRNHLRNFFLKTISRESKPATNGDLDQSFSLLDETQFLGNVTQFEPSKNVTHFFH
jgi:hypothetical protein